MRVKGSLPGSAALLLVPGVAHLDPPRAVFEAMVEGWGIQQRVRALKCPTISGRVALVRRLAEFTNLYPWQWSPGEVEAFIDHLRSRGRPLTLATVRNYEVALRLFMDYVTDARYGWPGTCIERFGEAPVQPLHEWNTVAHRADFEGNPRRRPLSYDEVQALFDAADAAVEAIRARGRKGALAAQRDAALLKTIYAYGLRRSEAWGLDVADLRHNPKAKRFGRIGAVMVRHGKAARGGPAKRRTVLTVPEMDWVVPVLEQWFDEVRPLFRPGAHPAVWVTERCGRMSRRAINDAFAQARDDAGLPSELDLHCLRHFLSA